MKKLAIEINNLNEPVGKQDQYIASHGGLRIFKYLRNGNIELTGTSLLPGK